MTGATQLSTERLIALAERESGAHGRVAGALHDRIAGMVEWINAQGPWRPDQIEAMQAQVRQVLANRLRIMLDRERFPAIAEEKIDRPIFIIGFARSGTTLLHSLLAEDPELLAPQSWHVLSPSPPPGAGPVAKGRIDFAQRAIEAWMDFCPGQRAMHPYIDKGAFQLCEDEEVFTLDMRNMYPYHYYRVPVPTPQVVLDSDKTGALRFHREMLQHWQWNTGRTRWVCKGPSMQQNLEALFEVYPDAICVWPHRPLGDIYASNVALRAAVYDTITGEANDWVSTSAKMAEGVKAAYDALLANDAIDDPRIMHMPFKAIAADPIGTARAIYERAGLELTPDKQALMQAWLDDPENRVDRYGRYPYSYEAFGLEKAWIEDLFADYSARFGLD